MTHTHDLINIFLKSNSLNIVFIGSGNVATQLGLALKSAKHNIVQVYSKQSKNANTFAKLLKCKAAATLKSIDTTADLYIIAIKDDEIKTIAKQLQLKNKIVVHTSGSITMSAIQGTSANIGVFYPIQTISKSKTTDFKNVPICIEANNKATLAILNKLAKSISTSIHTITSEQRKQIHLAAVFACNFANYLYTVAEDILHKQKLPLRLLYPLIEETAKQISKQSPSLLQTGPAKRNDKKVMQQHIKQLGGNKALIQVYKLMSKQIAESVSK